MECISELRDSLNGYFHWNKARMTCFVQMLFALFTTRTVNLTRLACVIDSKAKEQLSRYRRLQRFFSGFAIDFEMIAGFIFHLFFVGSDNNSFYLTMDRTNWKWGKSNINILTLGIVYKGTAVPIYWELLDKQGNSDTSERIELIKKFINQFGKERIAGLLCDREFIGKDWFNWLIKEKISFYIRIRNNMVTTRISGQTTWMENLFYDLKPGDQRTIEGKRKVTGCLVYLSALRLPNGELLIVATDKISENIIQIYGLRWEIETLFGCLKGRGFNFEDTHIIKMDRIKKLFALLAVAFAWAHKTGEWQSEAKPIKLKKHGRLAMSLFRVGLDYVSAAISNMFFKPLTMKNCMKILKKPIKTGLGGVLA